MLQVESNAEKQNTDAKDAKALGASLPQTSRLGLLLLHGKHVTSEQLREALAHQKTKGGRLGNCLIKLGYLSEDTLRTVLSRQLAGRTLIREQMIYTRDYMGILGLPQANPESLLKERVLPNLLKNRHRLPEQIRHLIEQHAV